MRFVVDLHKMNHPSPFPLCARVSLPTCSTIRASSSLSCIFSGCSSWSVMLEGEGAQRIVQHKHTVHIYKHALVQHSKVEGYVHTSTHTLTQQTMELYCPYLESTPFFSSQGIGVIRILLSPPFQFLLHALNVLLQSAQAYTWDTSSPAQQRTKFNVSTE